jgi:hypothetical protein
MPERTTAGDRRQGVRINDDRYRVGSIAEPVGRLEGEHEHVAEHQDCNRSELKSRNEQVRVAATAISLDRGYGQAPRTIATEGQSRWSCYICRCNGSQKDLRRCDMSPISPL